MTGNHYQEAAPTKEEYIALGEYDQESDIV